MSGTSAVIHKQNKLIRVFNELGAIDREHAINLEDVGIRRSIIFNRMVKSEVLIEGQNNKFFIDNEAAERFKNYKRGKAIVALIVFASFAALYYLLRGK